MQREHEASSEKNKRSEMTRYEKWKFLILVFIAALLLTQVVITAGSYLHSRAEFNDFLSNNEISAYCPEDYQAKDTHISAARR